MDTNFVFFSRYYSGDDIEVNEMGGDCGKFGG
jgi:hypothetical protein